ncbi:helix-turn-helix transcriptional regulator [Burkholderia multivorans]|uniref:winged helix-turn-helix transcriptional regulator n=1 Tax=Burkholderia multivorans TaxID=87883 RepID=UPI001CC2C6F9|nr:helix-turn-helix domain-containing protein [Burkholderia multivorans]UQN70224.1 helix-turn-helix transcriptional regulator [Burkholderia multivorans]UQN75954.1 helix-turn-helix transcriptional regulator [Burkholderia multivorans]
MALLSGLWTPELVWCLSNGPRRFSELRRDNPTITAKVLTGRLRDLEARGVLERNVLETSPPSVEYALTSLGRELLPAITSIVEVGSRLLLRETSGNRSQGVQSKHVNVRATPQRPSQQSAEFDVQIE